jgi:2-oxo-4-hydroxy-4-carboxy-5-ureidoimidazoline decarboxylase
MTLDDINSLSTEDFVAEFGAIYEHSPWIAAKACAYRPFSDTAQMLGAFAQVVRQADKEAQLAIVKAHPELGHRAGIDQALSTESQHEQGGAGVDRLTPAEYEICVRKAGKSPKAVILEAMATRLQSSPNAELAEALTQIDAIASLRLQDKVQL